VRVVHSELGGKYDALALEMVKYIKLPLRLGAANRYAC
jgi:hypothetical protein